MSRSYRKTPILPYCGDTEKAFKRQENRRLRSRDRSRRAQDEEFVADWREGRASWGPKDGKGYVDVDDLAQRLARRRHSSPQREAHKLLGK